MEYRLAGQAAIIGGEILGEHHPHLLGVRVEYVFMDKTPKSKGREVWGRAKKISGLPAFLSSEDGMREHYDSEDPQDFFVIEISEEVWERLSPKGRRALIDHELSHCDITHDDEGHVSLAIVGHDVTEFEAVLRRHGLWNGSVEDFVKAGAEQLSLDDGEPRGDEVDSEAAIEYQGKTVSFTPENLERVAEGARHLRTVRS